MVTVQDEEARRIEQQPEEETKAEIMAVLRKMFGDGVPEMSDILIPKWGHDRFYKGTYSNWPIGVSVQDFHNLKAPVGPIFFTGEHTSHKYNGFVHGAYLAGIDTASMVLDCINNDKCPTNSTIMNTKTELTNTDTDAYPNIKRYLSNGKYKNADHQAVVNASCSRLSIATFQNPAQEAIVYPLNGVINFDEGEKCVMEEPITFAQMYRGKMNRDLELARQKKNIKSSIDSM